MNPIADGRKTVAATATAERLVAVGAAGAVPVSGVIITAETDNTGVIAVGGSTVVAALATRRGVPLAAGESVMLSVKDLSSIWLDTTIAGDGVTWLSVTD